MVKRGVVLGWLFFIVFFISNVSAIPKDLNIQGKLTNSSTGNALEGTYSLNFSIYNVATGGSPLWSGVYSVNTDRDGIYSVILKNVDLDFTSNYFLGIRVSGDSEMTPRINMTSSPYAFRAQNISVAGIEFDSNVNIGAHNFSVNTNSLFVNKENGYVGIGTTSPGAKLDVKGDGNDILQARDSSGVSMFRLVDVGDIYLGRTGAGPFIHSAGDFRFAVASGYKFRFSNDNGATYDSQIGATTYFNAGNVGIGTTTPGEKLEVAGKINASTDVCITGGACLSNVGVGGANVTGSGTANYLSKWVGSSTLSNSIIYADGTNVGIGTGSPSQKLDVRGSAYVSGNIGIGTAAPKNKLDVEGGLAVGSSYSGTNTAPTNGAIIEGKVGIGLNNPGSITSSPLVVNRGSDGGILNLLTGTASGDLSMGFWIYDASNYASIDVFEVGTGIRRNLVLQPTDGNVGIGTSDPKSLLHLKSNNMVISLDDDDWAVGTQVGLLATTGSTQLAGMGIKHSSSNNLDLIFYTDDNTALMSEKMRIQADGNVGIGASNPIQKLEVAGNVNLSSSNPTMYLGAAYITRTTGGDVIISD